MAIKNIKLLTNTARDRLAGIVSFQVEHANQQKLYKELMQKKVICANRYGGIRFSPHFYTPQNKIDNAINILSSII